MKMESDQIEEGEVVESPPTNSSMSFPIQPSSENVFKTTAAPVRAFMPLPHSSDSESGEASGDSSDDEDSIPRKRSFPGPSQPVFAKNLTEGPNRAGVNDSCLAAAEAANQPLSAAAKRALKYSKNNVWGAVMQEQELSHGMNLWSGVEKTLKKDRSVESYDYRKAKELYGALEGLPSESKRVPTSSKGAENVEKVSDLCDIETFGAVDPVQGPPSSSSKTTNRLKRHRKSKKQNKRAKKPPEGKTPGNVKSRLGSVVVQGFDQKKDRSNVGATASDGAESVSEVLMGLLKEPPHMKETFLKVVQTIGQKSALELLYKTQDIEDKGGMMILNGSRRRTPGGVYLYLVKTELPHHISEQIFDNHRTRMKESWQRKKEQRWKNHVDRKLSKAAATDFSSSSELKTTDENAKEEIGMEIVTKEERTSDVNDLSSDGSEKSCGSEEGEIRDGGGDTADDPEDTSVLPPQGSNGCVNSSGDADVLSSELPLTIDFE